jgi:hypothetical protein
LPGYLNNIFPSIMNLQNRKRETRGIGERKWNEEERQNEIKRERERERKKERKRTGTVVVQDSQ